MDVEYLNELITTAARLEKLGAGESPNEASALSLQKFELSREKYDLAQQKFIFDQYKVEVDKAKSTISSLTTLYGQTKSVGMKNYIRNTMSSFYEETDPVLRRSLEPYIKHSPISELEQKKLNFDQLYNRIPKPVFNPETKNYLDYAENWFNWSDSENFRSNFITGKKPEKQMTLGLPDGYFAVRDSNGTVRTLSPEQQGLEKFSKDSDVPVREIITGGGWVKSGEPYMVQEGGVRKELQNEMNLFTKESRSLTKSIKDLNVKGTTPKELPGDLKKLLGNVISENYKGNPMAKKLHELMTKDLLVKKGERPRTIGSFNRAMQQLYPNYVFLVKETDEPTVGKVDSWNSWEKNVEIIPLHARELRYKTKKGRVITFFERWLDGVILNKNGEEILGDRQTLEDQLKEEGSL